jgi:exodeoxyribonuclease VII small subunit
MTNKFSFEESMKRLETIVKTLESGQVSLDDSLSLYEEGI